MIKREDKQPRIGDIYIMFFEGTGSEQCGMRPGIVFQNNVGNEHSPNIIALPLTTNTKKSSQPTHVLLKANETGLLRDSLALCENPERMSKSSLGKYITTLSTSYMKKIATANILATSAISFLDFEDVVSAWKDAQRLNTLCA